MEKPSGKSGSDLAFNFAFKYMFNNIYNNKKVLITGHTGFKGSWLAMWLTELGADVAGYSLEPPTDPSHWDLIRMNMRSVIGDVRDAESVNRIFMQHRPEIVFHLAAQPIVRMSYREPIQTFSTNVMGTLNALEAARTSGTVSAFINVTSDKCYENKEQETKFRETDPLGGYDPYSASKGCSEIITSCWRSSFFNINEYGGSHHTLLASVRAGNVLGGGDWASDRLIPDIMRAAGKDEKVSIRNPGAVRAWQYVLDPLGGYLLLGQKLLEGKKEFAEAWNFGPTGEEPLTVGQIVVQAQDIWPKVLYEILGYHGGPYEAKTLELDCTKAYLKLRWEPVLDAKDSIEKTVKWYRDYYELGEVRSRDDLYSYISAATRKKVPWTADEIF